MANHKSSIKRTRQDKEGFAQQVLCKDYANAVRKLRNMSDKEEAAKLYPYSSEAFRQVG